MSWWITSIRTLPCTFHITGFYFLQIICPRTDSKFLFFFCAQGKFSSFCEFFGNLSCLILLPHPISKKLSWTKVLKSRLVVFVLWSAVLRQWCSFVYHSNKTTHQSPSQCSFFVATLFSSKWTKKINQTAAANRAYSSATAPKSDKRTRPHPREI